MLRLKELQGLLKVEGVSSADSIIRFTSDYYCELGFDINFVDSGEDSYYNATIYNQKIEAVIEIDSDIQLDYDSNNLCDIAKMLFDLQKEAKKYQRVVFKK